MAVATTTLRQLRDFALPRYRQELAAANNADGQDQERKDRNKVNVYSCCAFNAAARVADWDAPAGVAIATALDEAKLLENDRKPRAELQRALRHLKQLQKTKPLASLLGSTKVRECRNGARKDFKPFAAVLSSSIEQSGLPIAELARRVKMSATKLWKWANDDVEPSNDGHDLVNSIESHLKLKNDQLWNLRMRVHCPCDSKIHWPAGFPKCKKTRARVRKRLEGLAKLPQEEQGPLILETYKDPAKERTKLSLGRDLSKWPAQLRSEWKNLMRIKRNRTEPALAD
jgi:hypothetical protein